MGSRAMTDDATTKSCKAWVEIPKSGDCDAWSTNEDWILITAFWQDTEHFWRDIALWRDRPTNWVQVNG